MLYDEHNMVNFHMKDIHVIYIHNVKTAGSTVFKLFHCLQKEMIFLGDIRHNFLELFFDDYSQIVNEPFVRWSMIRRFGTIRFLKSHQTLQNLNWNENFVFTFVRNPYDKLYSAYHFVKKIHLGRLDSTKTPPEIQDPNLKDFQTFVRNYKQLNNEQFGHGFITQYDHSVDFEDIIKLNYIGKVETFVDDMTRIFAFLGILKTQEASTEFEQQIKGLSLNKSEYTMDIVDAYDEETLQFVHEYFAKDFEFFQYQKYMTLEEFRKNHHPPPCFKQSDDTMSGGSGMDGIISNIQNIISNPQSNGQVTEICVSLQPEEFCNQCGLKHYNQLSKSVHIHKQTRHLNKVYDGVPPLMQRYSSNIPT